MSVVERELKVSPEPQTSLINPPENASDLTQTGLANLTFYQQALQIQGASVQVHGDLSWNERTIVVTIPDLFDGAADEVFDLEIRTHQQYPQGRLDVLIKPAPVSGTEGQ